MFTLIHNKYTGLSLADGEKRRAIAFDNDTIKTLQPECVLPEDCKERIYMNNNSCINHSLIKLDDVRYDQDLIWEPGIWFKNNLEDLCNQRDEAANKNIDNLTTAINRKLNSQQKPTGVNIFQSLDQTGLLKRLMQTRDVNSLIGLLVYTVLLPQEYTAIDYTKKVIANLAQPLNEIEKQELSKILDLI